MGSIQIKGAEHSVSKIFSNDFAFDVPPYQRPYAWRPEQAIELLDDLLSYIGDGTNPVADMNPYFLGSIVVIKEDNRPEADVVDGQQRLTTLVILLSAIRSMLVGPEAAAITKYIYEKGDPIEDTRDRFRLTLRKRDAKFFQEHVQLEGVVDGLRTLDSAGLSDSQRNVKDNAVALLDGLAEIPDVRRKRLAQFIVTRCLLVVVSTPDFDSAYRIFTVLNNRGMDLSHADILKSEIVGSVPPDQQAAYTEKWEEAEVSLGRRAGGVRRPVLTHPRHLPEDQGTGDGAGRVPRVRLKGCRPAADGRRRADPVRRRLRRYPPGGVRRQHRG